MGNRHISYLVFHQRAGVLGGLVPSVIVNGHKQAAGVVPGQSVSSERIEILCEAVISVPPEIGRRPFGLFLQIGFREIVAWLDHDIHRVGREILTELPFWD